MTHPSSKTATATATANLAMATPSLASQIFFKTEMSNVSLLDLYRPQQIGHTSAAQFPSAFNRTNNGQLLQQSLHQALDMLSDVDLDDF